MRPRLDGLFLLVTAAKNIFQKLAWAVTNEACALRVGGKATVERLHVRLAIARRARSVCTRQQKHRPVQVAQIICVEACGKMVFTRSEDEGVSPFGGLSGGRPACPCLTGFPIDMDDTDEPKSARTKAAAEEVVSHYCCGSDTRHGSQDAVFLIQEQIRHLASLITT